MKIPVFLLLLISCFCVTFAENEYIMQLSLLKQSYILGEPLLIKITIQNHSANQISIPFHPVHTEGYGIAKKSTGNGQKHFDYLGRVAYDVFTERIEIPPYTQFENYRALVYDQRSLFFLPESGQYEVVIRTNANYESPIISNSALVTVDPVPTEYQQAFEEWNDRDFLIALHGYEGFSYLPPKDPAEFDRKLGSFLRDYGDSPYGQFIKNYYLKPLPEPVMRPINEETVAVDPDVLNTDIVSEGEENREMVSEEIAHDSTPHRFPYAVLLLLAILAGLLPVWFLNKRNQDRDLNCSKD